MKTKSTKTEVKPTTRVSRPIVRGKNGKPKASAELIRYAAKNWETC